MDDFIFKTSLLCVIGAVVCIISVWLYNVYRKRQNNLEQREHARIEKNRSQRRKQEAEKLRKMHYHRKWESYLRGKGQDDIKQAQAAVDEVKDNPEALQHLIDEFQPSIDVFYEMPRTIENGEIKEEYRHGCFYSMKLVEFAQKRLQELQRFEC